MPADIDPETEEVEPEERSEYVDTGPEARGEDELVRFNAMQGFDTTFRFGGKVAGWKGRAPESINQKTNPTLDLEAGKRYKVVWENLDGLPHNFVIQNSSGERLMGTDIYSSKGKTVSLTFVATAEMSQYICTVHPNSMVGNINVHGGTAGGGDQATGGPLEQPEGPGATQKDVPQLDVTTEMIREDRESADSWLVYDKGYGQRGYTPADGLDAENVASLTQKYSIPTDSAGMETSPIIVPSDPPVMYYTTSNLAVTAANARTGEKFWTFKYALPPDAAGQTGWNRGVAVWQDKIYFATTDSHLVALNRYTGEKEWDELLLTEEQQEMVQPRRMSVTQAPVAYDGNILIGMSGDFGGWTVVSSYDADSGEVNWQKNMAPKEAWVDENWRFASNAPWMSPSVDPESNTVFYAVGNPCPMLNGAVRPGPNHYSNSIIALDIETGEVKWTNQLIAHGLWDYDAHTTPYVFDMETDDGETRRVVGHDAKTGWTYLFDVETGRLIERSAPWAKQDHEWADHFLALPPKGSDNPGTMWPPTAGATEWPPNSYDPNTGMRYVAAMNAAQDMFYDPDWEYKPEGDIELAVGGSYGPAKDTTSNVYVRAVDPKTGDLGWKTELPDTSESWSAWRSWPGGTTATGGGLVFVASSGGHVYALDNDNGDVLWSGDTDAERLTATPVVWEDPAQDTQYVAVAADDEITVWSSGGFE